MNMILVQHPTLSKYMIGFEGELYSKVRHRLLKGHKTKLGYIKYVLRDNNSKRITRLIHRLMGETFLFNPDNKPQINHKNGIKDDNRIENLEWCTPTENVRHAYKTGLMKVKKGFEHHTTKLTIPIIKRMRELRKKDFSYREISIIISASFDIEIKTTTTYKVLSKNYKNWTDNIE